MTVSLAWVILQEALSVIQIGGIVMTLGGIAWVISERVPAVTTIAATQVSRLGLSFGLLAALAQASGVILSRSALAETAVDPLWSALIRLVAGFLSLCIWLALKSMVPRATSKTVSKPPSIPLSWRLIGAILVSAFLGTYLGIWLQQVSLKYAAAGIAQTLLSTSPLFVLPIVAGLGEKISWRSLLGAVLALVGVAILFQA
jgi:drug/metabolite transporter (DMT)-like permease